jgi:cell division protein ZapA
MDNEPISIKVNIGGRPYPLRISWKNEEQVRKAAKLINKKLEEYMEKVSYRDHQDLLAITALDYAIDSLNYENAVHDKDADVYATLESLEKLLDIR